MLNTATGSGSIIWLRACTITVPRILPVRALKGPLTRRRREPAIEPRWSVVAWDRTAWLRSLGLFLPRLGLFPSHERGPVAPLLLPHPSEARGPLSFKLKPLQS